MFSFIFFEMSRIKEETGLLSHKGMTDPSTTGIYHSYTHTDIYIYIVIYYIHIVPICVHPLNRYVGVQKIESHLRFGLQYLLSSGKNGQTTDLSLHSDCLGNGEDPLAKTFDQVPVYLKGS